MEMIKVIVDGIEVEVPEGTTALEAAKAAGVDIPTLCYLKGINEIGACRMCLVEVVGGRGLQASCVFPMTDGMEIKTNTPKVINARRVNLELILSNHEKKCLSCVRSQNCELQDLAKRYNVDETAFAGESINYPLQNSSTSIVRDNNKCILCRRCVAVCKNVQGIAAIAATGRGFQSAIAPPFEHSLEDTECINCGQCIKACPVGALREKDDTDKVWEALNDETKHVVVSTAPSVRVGLGEEFGMEMGSRVTGKMVTALRRLGFDKVFDTDFAADLTIMEEGTELLNRINNGGVLPLITSCSPGWVKYCEHFFPDFIDNLSSCKSPQGMQGAMIKSYYAEQNNIDPKDIVSVSIMPCTAKKFEADRPEFNENGMKDNDIVITTREFARMIKQAGYDFEKLEEQDFDLLMGESSGAGVIFGATGGVMEAALRTVYEIVTGKELESLEFTMVRGIDELKEASVMVGDMQVNVAVVNTTGSAKKVLEQIRNGEKEYHFIEVMACPGGCVNGGGQPIVKAKDLMDRDPKELRAKAIYEEDAEKPIRRSHKNPMIEKIYADFLGEPNSHKAHELLHTHYVNRGLYKTN